MSDIFDGGPAFPVADFDHQAFAPNTVDDVRRLLSGMSLRDYFAAKAMQGMAADPTASITATRVAAIAYEWADAMLDARAEPQPVQYREMYPGEREKLTNAERLAGIVEDLQREPVWPMLPEVLRIAARDAASNVLDPEIPF